MTLQARFECRNLGKEIHVITDDKAGENVNAYLVHGSKKDLLIDTGLGKYNRKKYKYSGSHSKDIKELVTSLGARNLIVVNTHNHYDHVGGNKLFDDVRSVQKKNLKPGEVIDLGDRKIEVIGAPGHSHDSVMFLDDMSKSLFLGDLAYDGTIYAQFNSKVFGRSNLAEYVDSLKKVEALVKAEQVVNLRPGHNGSVLTLDKIVQIRGVLERIMAGEEEPMRSRFGLQFVKKYCVDGVTVLTK